MSPPTHPPPPHSLSSPSPPSKARQWLRREPPSQPRPGEESPTWPLALEGEAAPAAASAGCCWPITSPLAAFELWLPMMRAGQGCLADLLERRAGLGWPSEGGSRPSSLRARQNPSRAGRGGCWSGSPRGERGSGPAPFSCATPAVDGNPSSATLRRLHCPGCAKALANKGAKAGGAESGAARTAHWAAQPGVGSPPPGVVADAGRGEGSGVRGGRWEMEGAGWGGVALNPRR